MTTEGSESSSAAAPESPAAEVEQQQPVKDAAPTPEPAKKIEPQAMPTHAPPAGTRYTLNEKTGMWDLVRLDEVEVEAPSVFDKEEEAAPSGEAFELDMPEEVAPHVVEDNRELVGEASALMSAAGYNQQQQQRVLEIYTMEAMAHSDAPDGDRDGDDAVLGYLREQWGSEYQQNLDAAVAMTKKLGSKFERWLGETRLGSNAAMLSTLAHAGRGLLSISKEDAQRQIAEIKKNFTPYGKDHKLTVGKLRALADRVARGEPNPEDARITVSTGFRKGVVGNIDKGGRSRENALHSLEESQAAGFNKSVTAPSSQAQGEIAVLREQQGQALKQHGRHSKEYRAISARITDAYGRAFGNAEHRA